MKLSLSGFGFLLGYIVMVGVASFLEKFSMKQLNPYQINFLMAIGMLVTAVPPVDKTGKLDSAGKSIDCGRTNRPLHGARLNLLCARSGKASSRDGCGNFDQVRIAGRLSIMALSK